MTESMTPNTPERLAQRDHNVAVVQRFYGAAATHDESNVVPVLTEDFVGQTTEGLPNGLGGVYHGNVNAVAKIWGRIWALFEARCPFCRSRVPPTADWFRRALLCCSGPSSATA
jgi:hypothetical protein